MQSLDDADRTAILLRYFENKSLRKSAKLSARAKMRPKNVSVALSSACVNSSPSANSLSAPADLSPWFPQTPSKPHRSGLAGAVALGAVLGSTSISVSAAVTLTKTIAMTTLQKAIIATVVAGALGVGLYQARVASNLREQVQTSKQQQEGQAALSNQAQDLQRERDRATNALAALATEEAVRRKARTRY